MTSMENTLDRDNGARSEALSNASRNAHSAINQASEAVRPKLDHLAESAHQTVDKLAGVAGRAADTFDVKAEKIKDAQNRLVENCRTQIRENPIATIGAAVAAGFLLSWMLKQR